MTMPLEESIENVSLALCPTASTTTSAGISPCVQVIPLTREDRMSMSSSLHRNRTSPPLLSMERRI